MELFKCTHCDKGAESKGKCGGCGQELKPTKLYYVNTFGKFVRPLCYFVVRHHVKMMVMMLLIPVIVSAIHAVVAIVAIRSSDYGEYDPTVDGPRIVWNNEERQVAQTIPAPQILVRDVDDGVEIHFDNQRNIRFTIDGSPPNISSRSGKLRLTERGEVHVNAISITDGEKSEIGYRRINLQQLSKPEISHGVGEIEVGTGVVLSSNNGAVHFTLDGSEPTINSAVYTSPIRVDRDMSIRARVFQAGYVPSEEVEWSFIAIQPPPPPPPPTQAPPVIAAPPVQQAPPQVTIIQPEPQPEPQPPRVPDRTIF